MTLNSHPNAHPSSGAYTNAAEVAASLVLVGTRTAIKSVQLVKHHAMLLETRIKAKASGRPGPKAQTGDYRRSWSTEITGTADGARGRVGTNKPQARRLEYGFVGLDRIGRSYNQPPFPHVGPALEETTQGFEDAVAKLGSWED